MVNTQCVSKKKQTNKQINTKTKTLHFSLTTIMKPSSLPPTSHFVAYMEKNSSKFEHDRLEIGRKYGLI